MNHKRLVLTRPLPKTGAQTSYRSGDDGHYEAGWWKGRTVANNKTRFLAKTLGGDDVVVDLATGLMWAADGNEAGCNNGSLCNWNDGIDYCNALDFAGFTDWRVPNIRELLSICDYSIIDPCIAEPPFANTEWIDYNYWSSTTETGLVLYCWGVRFTAGEMREMLKTGNAMLRAVRGGL